MCVSVCHIHMQTIKGLELMLNSKLVLLAEGM